MLKMDPCQKLGDKPALQNVQCITLFHRLLRSTQSNFLSSFIKFSISSFLKTHRAVLYLKPMDSFGI